MSGSQVQDVASECLAGSRMGLADVAAGTSRPRVYFLILTEFVFPKNKIWHGKVKLHRRNEHFCELNCRYLFHESRLMMTETIIGN